MSPIGSRVRTLSSQDRHCVEGCGNMVGRLAEGSGWQETGLDVLEPHPTSCLLSIGCKMRLNPLLPTPARKPPCHSGLHPRRL